jgi:catechol-2,3-dioxygenase
MNCELRTFTAPSISVSDLDLAEGFYQEVLGLRVTDESLGYPFRHALMARDGKTVLRLREQSGSGYKGQLFRQRPLAFEVESEDEVNRTKALLGYLGMPSNVSTDRCGSPMIQFEDPDGVRIKLHTTGCGSAGAEIRQLQCSSFQR